MNMQKQSIGRRNERKIQATRKTVALNQWLSFHRPLSSFPFLINSSHCPCNSFHFARSSPTLAFNSFHFPSDLFIVFSVPLSFLKCQPWTRTAVSKSRIWLLHTVFLHVLYPFHAALCSFSFLVNPLSFLATLFFSSHFLAGYFHSPFRSFVL